jgi:hypothetical protein
MLVIERELAVALAAAPPLRTADRQRVMDAVNHRVVRRLLLENVRRHDPGRWRRRMAA